MFVTQEKIIKRIQQDKARGEMKKALQRAVDGLERWPEDYDLATEAIHLSFDTGDFKLAVRLIKSTIRRHPGSRSQLMTFARETFNINFNPFLGSFIIETHIRSRNIEDIRALLRVSDQGYKDSLIKRSETRSKGFSDSGERKTSQFTDNELLLALLYMSCGRNEEAAVPLGKALANSPEDAQVIGELLLELERDLPASSQVRFTLGLVSFLLGHPSKAEKRFFQCLELDSPPLEPLVKLLESWDQRSTDYLLLTGEISIRKGDEEKGISLIREYLSGADQAQALASANHGEGFRDEKDRLSFAFKRITSIPDGLFGRGALAYFAAGIAGSLDRVKEGVEQLERLYGISPGKAGEIVDWMNGNDKISRNAPAQRFLLSLNISTGDHEAAATAARVAAEMDPASINGLVATIREALEQSGGTDRDLLSALAELHALNGDSENASNVMERLEEDGRLEKDELFRLTGKILDKCGVTLDRVMSAVQLSLNNADVSGALPWVVEFFRSNPDAHREFTSRLKEAAGDDDEAWVLMAEMIDSMASEVKLTTPFRILQARGHLLRGDIEKAVFEFDQMIMFNESIRMDLIPLYEKVIQDHPKNTMLNLALYQLNLDEEFYQRSAHYLCKALESDPGQIRDVLSNFEKLTAKDPENRGIWEEMLKTALRMDHADLARDILSRAIASLPESDTPALNVYGARIAAADGKSIESLGHLSSALQSEDVDLGSVEQQLMEIIRKEPMNPEARYLAGETLLRLTREEEAIAQMEKCLELSPAHMERVRTKLEQLLPMSVKPWLVSRILGEISWSEGRKADAYRFFNSAQKGPGESLHGLNETLGRIRGDSPADSRITSIYARGLSLEHRYDEAVQQLEDLFLKDGNSTGRITEILLEMLENSPEHFTANRLMARIWVSSGDPARSLAPLLQMMADREIDPALVERDVDAFLEHHERRTQFLVEYAGLKARNGRFDCSLMRFGQALTLDSSSSTAVLEGLDKIEWPEEFRADAALLGTDCLTGTGDGKAAFKRLSSIPSIDDDHIDALMDRLEMITAIHLDARYYDYGCRTLADRGDFGRAESFVRAGCERLGEEDSLRLKIALAEILEQKGMNADSARIFREIIDDSDDRAAIWKRIESAWQAWVDRELEKGTARIADGDPGPEESERFIRLAIDSGRPETALRMAEGAVLPPILDSTLRASACLAMDKPLLALAICGGAEKQDTDVDLLCELLNIEGAASEMIGDHGRAMSAFMKIFETGTGDGDARRRAEDNYTKLLESQIDENNRLLVKTGTLEPAGSERTER